VKIRRVMTDDERKAWDENIEDCKFIHPANYGPEPRCTAILAANMPELKKCQRNNEREGKELIHLRIVTESKMKQ